METSHRKIELQSPADLTYLTTQLRTAARQKLDLHLPPVASSSSTTSPQEPDDLRRHVEDLVEAFVAQIIQGMRGNISINGMDVITAAPRRVGEDEDMGDADADNADKGVEEEDFEPFDEKLRGQLAGMVARRDGLVGKISQHRRGTAVAAAEAWRERFEREGEGEGEGEGQDVLGEVVGEGDADFEALERREEVERNWERAVLGLQRLNKGLPETRARLERAGDVVGYLGGGKAAGGTK